ncbi:MAG: hypothetical protein R2755_08125 [Acidimicrobiales bacterium]
MAITCPWGNRLRVHEADERLGGAFGAAAGHALRRARRGARCGDRHRPLLRRAARRTRIAGRSGGARCATVRVGTAQALHFTETDRPLPDYDGHHIAVYLANFSGPYAALRERGLISMETNESEYRFQDIVDPDGGAVLFRLEHEVRSMRHPMFGRELVNRNATQSLSRYRAGADAFVGITHGGRG